MTTTEPPLDQKAGPVAGDPPPGEEIAAKPEQEPERNAPITDDRTEIPVVDAAKVFSGLLERIWNRAHREVDFVEDEREAFVRRFLQSTNVSSVFSTEQVTRVAPEPGTAVAEFTGDIQQVHLRVSRAVDRANGDPEQLARLIRGPLASTLERFEIRAEANQERRADVVVRTLQPLVGRPESARLAIELARYLQSQAERGGGYWATMSNVATLVYAGGPEFRDPAAVLLHLTLRGMWAMSQGPLSDDDERVVRGPAQSAAHNAASMIIREARQHDDQASVRDHVRRLKSISAAFAPELEIDTGLVASLLDQMGLPVAADRVVDVASAILDMGNLGSAWGEPTPHLAHLEAMAGVIAATSTGQAGAVPSAFFNAGVSLIQEPGAASEVAQLVYNALGLRWSLAFTTDVAGAFAVRGAMDCAVNYVLSVVALKREDSERASGPVLELAGALAAVVRDLPPSADEKVELDMAKIQRATQGLKVDLPHSVNHASLSDLVAKTIDVLTPGLPPPLAAQYADKPFVQDSADIAVRVFRSLVDSEWTLASTVREVAQSRRNPMPVLADQYSPYAHPLDDKVGTGPFVGTLFTEEEWRSIAVQLVRPVTSIVPALRSFGVE